MTDPLVEPLAKYFEADAAPAIDHRFRLEVIERVARKQFFVEMTKNTGIAAALILCTALTWPTLSASFTGIDAPTMTAFSILGATGLMAYGAHWLASRRWLLTHRWHLGLLLPR